MGRTLTTNVSLKSVAMTIKKYAFASTPYPLILSIENHCHYQQNEVMVSILKDELGDSIATFDDFPLKPDGNLPSPEDLKYKILLKTKLDKETPPSLANMIYLPGTSKEAW